MAMAMIALPFAFTACGNIDNPLENLGTQETPVLAAALQEGALISYTFSDGTDTYTVTFKKVGDNYVRQDPAATRATFWTPEFRAELKLKGTVVSAKYLEFMAYGDAAGQKPRLQVITDIADGSTQIGQFSDDPSAPDLKLGNIKIDGASNPGLDDAVNKAKNGHCVVFKTEENSDIIFEAKVTSDKVYMNSKAETWDHYIEFRDRKRVANRLLLYVEGDYVNAKLLCGDGEHSEDIEFQVLVNDNRVKPSDIIFPESNSASGGTVVCILKRVFE